MADDVVIGPTPATGPEVGALWHAASEAHVSDLGSATAAAEAAEASYYAADPQFGPMRAQHRGVAHEAEA